MGTREADHTVAGRIGLIQIARVVRIVAATISLYLITHLFVLVALPVAILLGSLDRERIPELKTWFVQCIFAIVGTRLKVSGLDNYTPDRRYVIVSNYPSGYAGFALIGTFPHASVVANAFLRNIPILGQALRMMGAVFVRTGRSGEGRKALNLFLDEQEEIPSIILLPEGKITRDGKIQRFRRGYIHIQRQTSCDILPITLNGLFQLKTFGRIYADPDAKPEMIIHPPIRADIAGQMSDEALISHVRETIVGVYQP
jgi:1-acyl-sn-glycerol-3-phosphate acyltransferase